MAGNTASLLVFSLNSLNDAHSFVSAVHAATEQSSSAITMIVFCKLFDTDSGLSHTASWGAIHHILSLYYVEASRVAQAAGKVLLRIDVLLSGLASEPDLPQDVEYTNLFRINGGTSISCVSL